MHWVDYYLFNGLENKKTEDANKLRYRIWRTTIQRLWHFKCKEDNDFLFIILPLAWLSSILLLQIISTHISSRRFRLIALINANSRFVSFSHFFAFFRLHVLSPDPKMITIELKEWLTKNVLIRTQVDLFSDNWLSNIHFFIPHQRS